MKFHLKVTDAFGTVKKDSVTIGFSRFAISIIDVSFNILNGDTVVVGSASGVFGGLGTLSYLWQPNHGLIDSTSNILFTSPNHSLDYYCTVTDAFGCSITTPILYHVFVQNLNVPENADIDNSQIKIHPNPTS
jgi:hypothetical protein